MELENYISLTTVLILVNSIMGKLKAKDVYSIQMGIFMLEIGRMIKRMVLGSIFQEMELYIKGNGKTI